MRKTTEELGKTVTDYNNTCFEYMIDVNDNLGKIKSKKANWSEHRILVYLCGFLRDNQSNQ